MLHFRHISVCAHTLGPRVHACKSAYTHCLAPIATCNTCAHERCARACLRVATHVRPHTHITHTHITHTHTSHTHTHAHTHKHTNTHTHTSFIRSGLHPCTPGAQLAAVARKTLYDPQDLSVAPRRRQTQTNTYAQAISRISRLFAPHMVAHGTQSQK